MPSVSRAASRSTCLRAENNCWVISNERSGRQETNVRHPAVSINVVKHDRKEQIVVGLLMVLKLQSSCDVEPGSRIKSFSG